MTDLYTPEGVLDYAAAAAELRAAKHITNDVRRADTVALITGAALLDIAVSLGALVSTLASDVEAREVGPDGEPMGDPERETDEPVDERPLEVGDHVAPRSAAGTPLAGFEPVQITKLGESEGAVWVETSAADLGRMWADNLVRVIPLDPDEEFDGTEPEHDLGAERKTDPEGYDFDDEDADEPDPRDAVEELDADFDAPPASVEPTAKCGALYRVEGRDDNVATVTCARKPGHEGKHRKGNLKWAGV